MRKRKWLALVLTATLAASMIAGCKGKETPTASDAAETVETKADLTAEKNVTVIQNKAVPLSDFLSEVEPDTGYSVKTVTLDYDKTSVAIDTDGELPEPGKGDTFTVAKTEGATTLMSGKNVPNVSLTFSEVTDKAKDLTITFDLENSKGTKGTAEAVVAVTVVPEAVSEVAALTKNLKLSQDLKEYDFDVYASNIQQEAGEDSNIKSVTVKEDNVDFGKPGHYEVTYEVEFKEPVKVETPGTSDDKTDAPDSGTDDSADKTDGSDNKDSGSDNGTGTSADKTDGSDNGTGTSDGKGSGSDVGSVDIPTDVEVVDKDEEKDLGDDVIKDNVKPGEKPADDEKETDDGKTEEDKGTDDGKTEETGSSSGGSASGGSGSSSGGSSGGSSGSSGGSSGGSGGSSGSSGGSSGSSGGSSGGGGSTTPPHVCSWTPHTATRWHENWVTVYDHVGDYECKDCHAMFYDEGSVNAHVAEHLKAHDGVYYGYYSYPCSHTHSEDQGWNETYTDYYYCSCGATKPA